ncbi:MAG: sigma-54-dependent Fis family transcriptional regulator [Polyangiaceae bacterium]|nr:sigma-54-dependent Fis family transcriptional regulator [Polyangiaceae bacterium]
MVDILAKHLDRLGYAVSTATGGAEALLLVEQGLRPDVVLADIRMPGMDGRTLMTELLRRVSEVRVVLMTAFGAISDAVEAMREGAYWYLTKPFKVEEAAVVLRHATAELTMGRRLQRLERTVRDLYRPERYLGRSERAQATRRDMLRAAELRTVVLITGETGSGKELAAHIIHASGPRANGPFVPVNCSAIPETLFESELFGHKRGAFTGATQDSPGLVEEAEGGTLFLDEVGELPLSQQPKLLRLLEEGEVRRVGERLARKVDVRVIAATNRSLEALVRAGQFRQDLFYRLAALVLPLPTLAERAEDIPLLAEALLVEVAHAAGVRAKGFTAAALAALARYAWPGNVRELRNAIEQALFRARGPTIDEANLPGWLTLRTAPTSEPSGARDAATLATLDEIERAHIERVLGETGWNRSRAAEILGIDRRTLFTRVQRYGLVGPT